MLDAVRADCAEAVCSEAPQVRSEQEFSIRANCSHLGRMQFGQRPASGIQHPESSTVLAPQPQVSQVHWNCRARRSAVGRFNRQLREIAFRAALLERQRRESAHAYPDVAVRFVDSASEIPHQRPAFRRYKGDPLARRQPCFKPIFYSYKT